jgi:hypothetical protein
MGLCSLGQSEVSLKAIELICPGQAKKAASEAIETALERLGCEVKKFIKRVNQQPVYTISEFLIEKKISPRRAVILGGPAETIAPLIERVLAIPCLAPAGAATANALGAALAKPTLEAELYADTDHGTLSVPVLNVARSVKGDYNLNKATMDLMQLMGGGSDLRVVAAESFNQTSGHGRSGKIIRVAVQSEPGLSSLLEGAPEA